MGYIDGAAKYFLMGLIFNPVSLWIHGGSLFYVFDLLSLIGSDSFQELAIRYIWIEYGPPASLDEAIVQLLVGAAVATVSWFVGSYQYARSRGWV